MKIVVFLLKRFACVENGSPLFSAIVVSIKEALVWMPAPVVVSALMPLGAPLMSDL